MHFLLAAISIFGAQSAPDWNELAKTRNSSQLESVSSEKCKGKFSFLKGSGAFGVGQSGWKAIELKSPNSSDEFVVFTSALTTQDYGDQVFQLKNNQLESLVEESNTLGIVERHIDFEISNIDTTLKKVSIAAKVSFEKVGQSGKWFFIRLGDNYVVDKVLAGSKEINFSQAGGVICLPTGEENRFVYTFSYSGIVNRPRFAGATTAHEMMLTNDYWWPSIGRLPITYRLKATVPETWEVVAQGNLTKSLSENGLKTQHFEMDLPISYLSLSMGDYKKVERTVNGRKYLVWSREMTDDEMDVQLHLNPAVIEFFDSVHAYPFQQWGSLVTALYGGGALEAYSYATYGTGWLPDEDAHEPSHTWFGGVAPNTYLNSFWNESFAAFSEGWYAREGSVGNQEEKRLAFVKSPRANNTYKRGAVWDSGVSTGGLASALGYGKGADVLQQLEFEMGRDEFRKVITKWLNTRTPGTAADWQEFANVCGPKWSTFIDQWLKRPGYPEMSIKSQGHANGVSKIEITFDSDPYNFLLEAQISYQDHFELKTVQVEPKEGDKTFVLELPTQGLPTMISLDPYDRLLGPNKPRLSERYSQNSSRLVQFIQKGYEDQAGRGRKIEVLPADLDGVLLIGDPEGTPEMKPLLAKVGLSYADGKLIWRGTAVDISKGAGVAMVEFAPGKWCGIRIGKTRREPNIGNAQVALVDEFGRFLRGKTVPRTSGPLVLTLP